jgi:hypothetical protein
VAITKVGNDAQNDARASVSLSLWASTGAKEAPRHAAHRMAVARCSQGMELGCVSCRPCLTGPRRTREAAYCEALRMQTTAYSVVALLTYQILTYSVFVVN